MEREPVIIYRKKSHYEDHLAHYGVKGMKWRHRKAKKKVPVKSPGGVAGGSNDDEEILKAIPFGAGFVVTLRNKEGKLYKKHVSPKEAEDMGINIKTGSVPKKKVDTRIFKAAGKRPIKRSKIGEAKFPDLVPQEYLDDLDKNPRRKEAWPAKKYLIKVRKKNITKA